MKKGMILKKHSFEDYPFALFSSGLTALVVQIRLKKGK